ncbi:NACHT domain-containing protein [Streptomyces yaizuensis]|uniref:NACHT domain-containing protein n=1 Tax=Streptomyces yaizuensis TaxID=2989713 RepID=A0ABQ5P0Z6_9ACTN|nr:NACHT domain-containing protein [Streptomyces sp. YSPA8]GLF96098.1 NACHT domain-containing protein [Streptomyces sp. YSPA8]
MNITVRWRAVLVRGRGLATGLLIDPRHILTSADAVQGREAVEIARHGTGDRLSCRVVWTGGPGDGIALLAGETDLVAPQELGPLRLGRLDHSRPLTGCGVYGFVDDGFMAIQATGTVLPLADRDHGVLRLDDTRTGRFFTDPAAALVYAGPALLGIATGPSSAHGDGWDIGFVPIGAVRDALHAGTDVLLPPLRDPATLDTTDSRWEAEYAQALTRHYGRLEVFGVDELGVSEATWDLDTAYLSLRATRLPEDEGPRFGADGPALDPGAGPQRVEDLLGRRPRTLLRGEAGAGKTTLVWWLAAHAARGTLPARLNELNGLVPFVVPLRSVHARGEGFPGPEGLAHAAGLATGPAPDGWAQRVLASGRALLLVDGLDELPQADRPAARDWLASLLRHHGATRVLATVRPGAVEAQWLADEGFTDLLLLPMSDGDITRFVTAWHRAARLEYAALDTARADAENHRLDELERKLGRELAGNRVLRDLARTPLLCAVICALHRKRRGALPHTLRELYRATLDMLLGNRDRGRGIEAPEGLTLGVEEHKLLLQHIAVWLVRCGRTQLTPEEAVTQIDLALAGMPQVRAQGGPRRVLTHLLNRSGLLQQRTGDAVQFIHRTFQDYLAAKEFAETGSVGELLQHAGDEQWRDVIRLSVAHFDRTQASALIRDLIALGDREPDGRSAHLLAGYCAVSSVYLAGPVRALADDRIRALMPPRDQDEVRELASFGAAVLPLLPGPSDDGAADALVVETIAGADDSAALEQLAAFADHPDQAPRRALMKAWSRQPAEPYARTVLSRLDMTGIDLEVHTDEQLRLIPHCAPASLFVVHGPHPEEALDTWLPRTGMRHLALVNNPLVTRLGPVRDRDSIRSLGFYGCPGLETLDDLAGRPLAILAILAGQLELPGGLPLPRTLILTGPQEVPYPALEQHWNEIERLVVSAPASLPDLLDTVARLPQLHELALSELTDQAAQPVVPAPRITTLTLRQDACRLPTDLLPRLFPALRKLRLILEAPDEQSVDLAPLRDLPDLSVSIRHPAGTQVKVTGREFFGDRLRITQDL